MSLKQRKLLSLRSNALHIKRTRIGYDTFTEGTTAITLSNHTPDYNQNTEAAPDWIRVTTNVASPSEAKVGGSASNVTGQMYNGTSSTARAYYLFDTNVSSSTYRIRVKQTHWSEGQAVGYIAKAVIYGSDDNSGYLGNVYYDARDAATSGTTGTPGWVASIERVVTGTNTVLSRICIQSTAAPTWPQSTEHYFEALPDGRKAIYVKLPGEAIFTKRTETSDTAITGPGLPGIFMDRCDASHGGHIDEFEVEERPAPPMLGGTPDPSEVPGLLWTPLYSNYIGTTITGAPNHELWFSAPKPRIRGITQEDRMQIVGGVDVPGTGIYKPTASLRVEVRDFWGTGAFTGSGGDQRITSTASATTSDTTLVFSSSDAAALFNKDMVYNIRTKEWVRVNGTPSGGNVVVYRGQSTTAQAVNVGDVWRVACGDVSDSGSATNAYATSRAEALARSGTEYGVSLPQDYPDPVGSVRYYGCSYYIEPTTWAARSYDGTSSWITLTQWKQNTNGSPPRALAIDVTNNRWYIDGFGGAFTAPIKTLTPGVWQRFIFGFRWQADGTGWTEVYDGDGTLLVPRAAGATMAGTTASPTPNYLKEGIYRAKDGWRTTMIFYYSPMKIGTDFNSVVGM